MAAKNPKIPQGGNKPSVMMILMLLIALAACGAAGYMFYEMKNMTTAIESDKKPQQNTAKLAVTEPLYVPLGTFTVSLKSTAEWKDPVAYIGLTLRVDDEQSKKRVEKFLPEIRSRIFMMLAVHTAENLSAHEGKKSLIDALKRDLSAPLAPEQQVQVVDVLINEFILR